MVDSTYQMILDREKELQPLYDRMDVDKRAYELNSYTMTGLGLYKAKEVPNTVSLTMNDASVYANAVVSVLDSAEQRRQVTILGPSDTASTTIENFLDDAFYMLDGVLRPRRISSLWAWSCFHVCHRGPVGWRLTWENNGMPDADPLDMRYVPFEDDHTGLVWIARHIKRTPEQIEKLYGLKVSGKLIDIYDYWTKKVNEVYIGGVKTNTVVVGGKTIERNDKNPYGEIPFIVEFPGSGSMFWDDDNMEHSAESIFWLARGLINEWNRLMSIQQTKAIELIKPPVTHEVQAGNENESPQPYPYEVGKNTPVREGEMPVPMVTPDINRAFLGAETGVATALHKAMPSISDLTEVQGERNAQWITEQTELRNKVLYPRLQALERLYVDGAAFLIRSYQKLYSTFTGPVKLGRNEAKREYKPADLGDLESYTIEYKYMPENKRQNLANYSVGLALRGELSRDTRFRDIYELKDPDGEIDKLAVEEAEQSDPVIFFRNLSKRLIAQAKKKTGDEKHELLIEASIMADNMVEAIKKRKMGAVGQGTRELQLPQGSPQGLPGLSKFMGGNGDSPAREVNRVAA